MRHLWIVLGCLAVGLGAVGIFVPLLPTTPLLLLAAFCFARSSDRLHTWLVTHPRFGPIIRDWREHRAVSRSSKITSTALMALVLVISVLTDVPLEILYLQTAVIAGVTGFLLSRPEPPAER
ncbi:MAG: YbaN family protein [Pseudomonadales bacterium]|nr:YbaN family protein [Pseudomonadales bacterium]MDP6471470.1 YbaN family protein [Pseudomonadales bacterium]MDP6828639.1 YbaN family protein [Pseudomonadales bacterium]MDP6972358.1 YbaN family protein [Pseudomonadales bacterium]